MLTSFPNYILIFLFISLLCAGWLHLCTSMRYITFDTNLNLYRKKSIPKAFSWWFFISTAITVLLFWECEKEQTTMILIYMNLDFKIMIKPPLKIIKLISLMLFLTSSLFIFTIAVTPVTNIFSVLLFQIVCYSLIKFLPPWVSTLLILLSNDIHLNPGPQYPPKFLNFMTWNLNSITTNNFERVALIEAHNSIFEYDIISICETNLKDSLVPNIPILNGYEFEHANHPGNVAHGGVGVYYKQSLPIIPRKDLSFSESLVLEIKFGRKKIFFTVLYRSPSSKHNSPEFEEFLSNFKDLHTSIKAENPYAMFFTGDFNGHTKHWWPDGDSNPEGRDIEDLFFSLNLTQIISEPRNFEPGKRPSCIDLIVTDQPNIVLSSGTRASLDPLCHHQIIYGKANFSIPAAPPSERKVWHYHRANTVAIQRSISNFPWQQHLNLSHDSDWQVKTFTEILLNIMSNFIPNEIKRFVPRDPPWITKQLKTLLNRKNRLFKNFKKHGYKADDKVRLDLFRKECQEAVNKSKTNYLKNLGNKLNDPNTCQKVYWKVISKVMNKCRASKIPPLLVNNEFILNCKDKAKHFSDFFSKQCKPIINNSTLPAFNFLTDNRIDEINIQSNEILSLIRNLNPNKATGSDGVSGQMLLLCDNSIVLPLKIIFENILRTSSYPVTWKVANVIPVFKKNDKQLIKNYRPISLLPICGKNFEKIIFNNLYKYFDFNNLITKKQSGFRPGDSTTNQLLYLVNEIHKAFENPKSLEVRAVFLDISKAFDKVWHDGLIFKLNQNGVHGKLLKLLESYLHNRKQCVVINGFSSEYSPIESGVPQGSVLGPLLFLIYINDLERNINSNINFFADDTMLFSIIKDPTLSAANLNHDLDLIYKWAYQWKLEFNPDPTKQATEVLFTCKKTSPNHPPLMFNGSVVAIAKEQKHLGLILDHRLSFEKHLNEKITKAKKNIGVIKHLSKYLPISSLDQMYKAFVRSHLDYCDIIYHEPSKLNHPPLGLTLTNLMEKVEKIQYQAALALTGTWIGTNRSKLYEELGWETLSERRKCRRILQVHKIENNLTPTYLKEKLPHHRQPGNALSTFHEIRSRTKRFSQTFFPDAIATWNIFTSHFVIMPSYGFLKKHVISLFRPKVKSIFGIHDPIGIRCLFQLRVSLSPLRSHKKHHNFIDTPSDICLCNQGIENTNHFLFECLFYTHQRAILAVSVIQILQKYNLNYLSNQKSLYLYGHDSISHSDNKIILSSTIKYIKDTQRFSA